MPQFVFNIISNHKTGNDYGSMLELLKNYPETINETYKGLTLLQSFLLNDYPQNIFSLPQLSSDGIPDKNIDSIYNEKLLLTKEKDDLLKYILYNQSDLILDHMTFDAILRQHYSCVDYALNFINQECFENKNEPPLHFAIKNNYYKLAQQLIRSGYNIFTKDEFNKIALYYVQEIESFNELLPYIDFKDESMSAIYIDCIQNIFKRTISKKKYFLEYILKYFSKNTNSEKIDQTLSLLLITESSNKLIKKYGSAFKKDSICSVMNGKKIYPLAYGSFYFICATSYYNYKGMLYYKDMLNKESIKGIKDGFLAHLAFISNPSKLNIYSAFHKPESDDNYYFMSFFNKEYKEKTYNYFIDHFNKAFKFFQENIELNEIRKENITKYHYNINVIFKKHFRVTVMQPLFPFFNQSIEINDALLINLLSIFNIYLESNTYLAKYYIHKKNNKITDNIYYGSFSDDSADIIILKYLVERLPDSLNKDTLIKIIQHCFKKCYLISLYSNLSIRYEKCLDHLSFIMNNCLDKLDSEDIKVLSAEEDKYLKLLDTVNIKDVNLSGIIRYHEYLSLSGIDIKQNNTYHSNRI